MLTMMYAAEQSGIQIKRGQQQSQEQQRKDRPDLYSDRWQGDVYTGSRFNVLNVILVVSVLVPLLGIGFALWSYGKVWG